MVVEDVPEIGVVEEVEEEVDQEDSVAQTRIALPPLPFVASGATVSPTVKMGTMGEQLDVVVEEEAEEVAAATAAEGEAVGLVGRRRRGKPWRS